MTVHVTVMKRVKMGKKVVEGKEILFNFSLHRVAIDILHFVICKVNLILWLSSKQIGNSSNVSNLL